MLSGISTGETVDGGRKNGKASDCVADVVALARQVIHGLATHPERFPQAPVPPAKLETVIDALSEARSASNTATVTARKCTAARSAAFDELTDLMKAALRCVKYTARAATTVPCSSWAGARAAARRRRG
jgi:hypothetical protein